MSDMKCPICQTVLDKAFITDKIRGCPKCRNMGNIELWQELITTKEKLLVCEECCRKWETDYHFEFEKSTRLENKLKTTRKALDYFQEKLRVAMDTLKEISLCYQNAEDRTETQWFVTARDMCDYADNAIEQIESITKGGKDE